MYMLMFEYHFIEYAYWWELVCELSKTFYLLYSLCHIFLSLRDEWSSPRDFGSLSSPSFHSFMMWLFLHVINWVDHHSFHLFIVLLSFSILLSIHLIHFTLLFFFYSSLFQVWYFFPHHSYTSHHQFDFLHCFLTVIISHWMPSDPWLMRF